MVSFKEAIKKYEINQDSDDEKKGFQVMKTDDEKRLVFGWAQVSITETGEQIEDHQEDIVDPEDLEEAAYLYVLNFRNTGEQHNPKLRKKGKLVESVVFTEEKMEAMGIPVGTVPIGWWVGFKIEDADAWKKVKSGDYEMFSVEGTGERVPIDETVKKNDKPGMIAKTFSQTITKYNPYHGKGGRFANRGAMTAFSPGKDPKTAARSIEREKQRMKEDGWNGKRESSGGGGTATPVKTLNTNKEAQAYGDKMAKETMHPLTAKQKDAVESYSSSIYKDINSYCRNGKTVSEGMSNAKVKTIVNHLDEAINQSKGLKESVTVYRGTSAAAIGLKPGELTKQNLQSLVGTRITDKGYSSYTTDKNIAEYFAMHNSGKNNTRFIIKTVMPKGKKAIPISALCDGFKSECELIPQRNTTIKIVSASQKRNTITINAEIID